MRWLQEEARNVQKWEFEAEQKAEFKAGAEGVGGGEGGEHLHTQK